MLDRPCLDARCTKTNPTRAPQYRCDDDGNKSGKKSPQTEPCGFLNSPKAEVRPMLENLISLKKKTFVSLKKSIWFTYF